MNSGSLKNVIQAPSNLLCADKGVYIQNQLSNQLSKI